MSSVKKISNSPKIFIPTNNEKDYDAISQKIINANEFHLSHTIDKNGGLTLTIEIEDPLIHKKSTKILSFMWQKIKKLFKH